MYVIFSQIRQHATIPSFYLFFMLTYFLYLQDDSKIEVEETIINDKDKYEKDNKKFKKESKEKESNKKKYDKKSGKTFY